MAHRNANERIRQAADNFRQELVNIFGSEHRSREMSLAQTKIDEAELWAAHLASTEVN
jgi:hypothetical protein